MRTSFLIIGAAAGLAAVSSPSQAAVVYGTVASQDRIVGERQSSAVAAGYYVDANSGLVGVDGSQPSSTRKHSLAIVGVTLPVLGVGESIASAELSFDISAIRDQGTANTLGSLDTYLLDSADPSITGTDFFYESGTVQTQTGGGRDVEHIGRTTRGDLGVSTSANGISSQFTFDPPKTITYTLTGDALALLQSFYTLHLPNQTEAFFRWNQTSNLTLIDADRYIIDSSSPKISITVIPEPGSLALLGAGSLLMLRRRKGAR